MTWKVFQGNRGGSSMFEVRDERGAVVVEVVPQGSSARHVEEAHQRAKMFAASPEMFGALIGLLTVRDERVARGEIPESMRGGRDGRYAVAQAAVNKARNGR